MKGLLALQEETPLTLFLLELPLLRLLLSLRLFGPLLLLYLPRDVRLACAASRTPLRDFAYPSFPLLRARVYVYYYKLLSCV